MAGEEMAGLSIAMSAMASSDADDAKRKVRKAAQMNLQIGLCNSLETKKEQHACLVKLQQKVDHEAELNQKAMSAIGVFLVLVVFIALLAFGFKWLLTKVF